tara:strand:- start:1426 stop:1665 length:240 start_codon:yes stop_codon:yes gene_type:complete
MDKIKQIIKNLNDYNNKTNSHIIFKLDIDECYNKYQYLIINTINVIFGEKPTKLAFNSKKQLEDHLTAIQQLYIKTFNK